jgi:hypothetical protein
MKKGGFEGAGEPVEAKDYHNRVEDEEDDVEEEEYTAQGI